MDGAEVTAAEEARRLFAGDQTAAALAQARDETLWVIAQQSPVVYQRPSRAYDALMERRLNDGFAAGQVVLCPHPDPQLYWLVTPASPAGCQPCVAAWAVAHLGGTDADTACDICGRGLRRVGAEELPFGLAAQFHVCGREEEGPC